MGSAPGRVMSAKVAYSSPNSESAWKRAAAQKIQPMVFSGRWERIRAPTTEKLTTRTTTAPSPSLTSPIRALPFRTQSSRAPTASPTHSRHRDQASRATFLLRSVGIWINYDRNHHHPFVLA